MNITLERQIKCVNREIGFRKRCYPRWVEMGRMKREDADREIMEMESVKRTLEALTDQARQYSMSIEGAPMGPCQP